MSRAHGPEGPLTGVRVLLTRSHADNAPLKRLLQAQGASVLTMPAIEVLPPSDWDEFDAVISRLGQYDWLLFTSRNAVHAVHHRLQTLDVRLDGRPRVGAVGSQTARAVEACGSHVHLVGGGTALSLSSVLCAQGMEGQRVLLPVGSRARPELGASIQACGATVDQVVVYRTEGPPSADQYVLHALRAGQIDAVALASPSAFENLADMLGEDRSILGCTHLVCIGPTTAEAVAQQGFTAARVAHLHTTRGLLAAIIDNFSQEHTND